MSAAALHNHLATLSQDERMGVALDRWGDGTRLADRFGIPPADVRAMCRAIDRAGLATGFARLKTWHDAILIHRELSATEKVAALRVWSFVNHEHLYAWPSQDRLASELGYSRGPNLGKALRRAFEIGAYTPVRVKDLPAAIRDQAVNYSHRSLRGIAYRLNSVEQWEQEAARFAALRNSNMFHGGTLEGSVAHHLNSQVNHIPTTSDSSLLTTVLPSGTVPIKYDDDVINDSCCSQPYAHARLANG